jgi:hypothetical protein
VTITSSTRPARAPSAVRSRPRGWRLVAALTTVAAGAVVLAGAFLPWIGVFAGLMQIPGVRGGNGRILAVAGALIIAAGLWDLAGGSPRARWAGGLAGFAAAGFAGYLLIQLNASMRSLGGDSMVVARPGPGLPVALTGALAAFATLLLPPSSQVTFRRDPRRAWPWRDWAADWQSTGPRRGLQVALGVIWLLDAALQYQPAMFTKAFPAQMLVPSAAGQPGFVSGPVLLAARLISANPGASNAAFATIQLALAAGLLFRPTARAALAGTIAWSLSVWWLGEGLGGIFAGLASPLTGGPGAAVLYALLAVLIWPAAPAAGQPDAGRPDAGARASVADGSPLGRGARLAWLILWGAMAWLLLRAPAQASALTAVAGPRAAVITVVFTVAFGVAAVGVLVPAATRPALAIAIVTAAAIWAAGEHFGGITDGMATDPNSGPLLALIAVAFWPLRGPLTCAGRLSSTSTAHVCARHRWPLRHRK